MFEYLGVFYKVLMFAAIRYGCVAWYRFVEPTRQTSLIGVHLSNLVMYFIFFAVGSARKTDELPRIYSEFVDVDIVEPQSVSPSVLNYLYIQMGYHLSVLLHSLFAEQLKIPVERDLLHIHGLLCLTTMVAIRHEMGLMMLMVYYMHNLIMPLHELTRLCSELRWEVFTSVMYIVYLSIAFCVCCVEFPRRILWPLLSSDLGMFDLKVGLLVLQVLYLNLYWREFKTSVRLCFCGISRTSIRQ